MICFSPQTVKCLGVCSRWWRPNAQICTSDVMCTYLMCLVCASSWLSNFFASRNSPTRTRATSFLRFRYHTQWHIRVGRTPLDERSARRRDLYLTTCNAYKRQISMHPTGFKPAIPASDRPQTLALDRSATVIDSWLFANQIKTFARNNESK